MQFLAEALTITFIGGMMGIILAYVVSLSVGRLTLYSAMAKNAEAEMCIRDRMCSGTASLPISCSSAAA